MHKWARYACSELVELWCDTTSASKEVAPEPVDGRFLRTLQRI